MKLIRAPRPARQRLAARPGNTPRPRTSTAKALIFLALCAASLLAPRQSFAQGCVWDGTPGTEGLVAQITVDGHPAQALDNVVVQPGTRLRLDAVAVASGGCDLVCEGSVIDTYNRTVNHIYVYADISTSGSLNGRYSVGRVQGVNPNGTSANLSVVDSRASNTTGPVYFTPDAPGTYRFEFGAGINVTPCNLQPDKIDPLIYITVHVGEKRDLNNGEPDCQEGVGEPVNVTNGNTYLHQTDYVLPGAGGGLNLTRAYNSNSKRTGLFGYGWTTDLDESIEAHGARLLKLNAADGQTVFFAAAQGPSTFLPLEPPDFRGQITRHGDGSYTLALSEGGARRFNTGGKLVSFADRNNNQLTLAYDSNGRPVTLTDPAGRIVTLAYNSNGRVSSVSDSLGTVATYTYGIYSTLTAVTYADGSRFNFAYDIVQNRFVLASVKDALNNVLEAHAYDAQGRALTSQRHGGAERYTLSYVGAAETHVTDALGHLTKYFFSTTKGRNVVTRVEGHCDCGGSRVETWAYDAQLNVTARTDALNRTTAYTYDTAGNRLTETDSLGTTAYTYNSLGQVLTVTDPMGGVTTYTYDALGNLLSVKDALDKTTSFTYTSRGQLQSVTDPRANKTEYTYDAFGNLTERKGAALDTTTFAYDARGRVTATTDALNHTTTFEYDLAGRLKKVTRPDAASVTFTYDLAGRTTKVKDARNNETSYEHDGAYRLTKVTDAATKTVTFGYDLMSNLTSETDQLGRVTNYEYDDLHRLKKTIYPEAVAGAGRLSETIEYDAAGNVTRRTDTAGRATLFEHDAADRLTKVTDPASQATRYEHNARSETTAVVDALGQRYEFAYDKLGRVTQATRGGAAMTFAYDAAGNRTERRDYNGALTTYAHDALNRLTGVNYPDETSATYGYDKLSRLTSATNQHGTVTLSYDSAGRLSGTTDVWGRALGYQYDANGNRTELRLGGALKATYQYDALNRLTQMTDGGAFAFAYDAAGRPTSRTAPNGVATTYEHDGLNRLTRLRHAKGAGVLADFQYQSNAAGQITQAADAAGAHAYAYDAADRLTSATHPNAATESYAYDGAGNRTASHRTTNYQYQPFNRAVTVGPTTYTYDANGNLTAKSDGAGSWAYAWDAENRLTAAALLGGPTVTYKYDALGHRIQRAKSTVVPPSAETTNFSYDGADVVLDAGGDGTTVEYVNGPGVDEKLALRAGGVTLHYAQDHLGSTRALADAAGNVVEQQTYDSFGDGPASALTRYAFTGREHDRDTGLYYYRARWYDPRQGRFISEDPIGFEGGANWYAYVENNPVNLIDPEGLKPTFSKCVTRCASGHYSIPGLALRALAVAGAFPIDKKR